MGQEEFNCTYILHNAFNCLRGNVLWCAAYERRPSTLVVLYCPLANACWIQGQAVGIFEAKEWVKMLMERNNLSKNVYHHVCMERSC